jgi:hypothetical protein
MSREARDHVWKTDKTGWRNGEIVVLLALAERADASGEAFPSVEHLQRMTGMDRRQVQRWLRRLEGRGLRPIAPGSGRHKSTTYMVLVPFTATTSTASEDRKGGPRTAVSDDEKGRCRGQKGGAGDLKGRRGDRPNRQEPSSEPSLFAAAPAAHRRKAAHRVAKKSARTDTPDPRVAVLLRLFCQTHEAILGTKYLCAGTRDAVAFKRALATYDEATIRATLAAYFRDRPSRLRYGAKVSSFVDRIGVLAATPDAAFTTERGRTVGNVEAMNRWLGRRP